MSLPALTAPMGGPTLDISVVICTYTQERWDNLVAAVASAQHQTLPPCEIIVVVDHNTPLLERVRKAMPGVVLIENDAVPGGNGSRNVGVAAAKGALVAFLDDDACADADWLAELAAGFSTPEVLVVGGMAEPVWAHGRPDWFPEEFDWVVGCSYRGMPQAAAPVRNVFSCNMAIRRWVWEEIGGFRQGQGFGRVGERPLGDEETEFCIRVRQRWPGSVLLYRPAAKVYHYVSPRRARRRYFRNRCYLEGRSKAMLARIVGAHDALSAERAYTLKTLPQGIIRGIADAISRREISGLARAGAIVAGLIATTAGYIIGAASLRFSGRKSGARSKGKPVDTGAPEDARGRQIPGVAAPRATELRAGPLRVLLVTPRFLPAIGGVETHVHEVGRRLARMGVAVTVLTADLSDSLPECEHAEGMCVRRVRSWPARRDLYFAPEIARLVSHGKWDVVHCQGVHTLVAPLAMLSAWHAGIPYVVTFHTGGHSSRTRNALRGAQWRMLRPLLARASKLIAVSEFEADYFRTSLHLPAELVTIIPNGAQMPLVRESMRHCAGELPSPHPLIVSPGRLERYKGHQRVIAALPYVRAVFPEARLLVLGAGAYKGALEQLTHRLGLDECVTIRAIPAADRCQMAAHLAQADLVTLLSEYEAQPIAVLEAAALGRSLLVADTSGLRELADRGLARTIPLHSSAHTVAEAILEQLRHPLVPAGIGLPTWDECADKLLTLYQSAARRSACAS